MSLAEFLNRLHTLGIAFRVRDGRLVCDASKAVLTPELLSEIGLRKREIISFIESGSMREPASLRVPPLGAIARIGPLPLTASQLRLWLLDHMQADESAAFNVPSAARIRGPLDIALLKHSLAEIVRRHEVLRTSFPAPDGVPTQAIGSGAADVLPVVDLISFPEDHREAEAERRVEEEARKAFHLGEQPPFRALLLRLETEDHLLVLVLHSIACDEWAFEILWREIRASYDALSIGKTINLPPLAIQCADFALWHREWLDADEGRQQLDYWRRKLATCPTPFELTKDRIHRVPPSMARPGGSRRLVLGVELSRLLASLARVQGSTLFMTLLASFQALLCRYTAQEDVLVGTSVAPREQPGLRDLIGNFANTIVMRTDLSRNPDFREILRRTRETAVEAFGTLDIPFERVVQALSPPRGNSGRPFFGCLFAMRNGGSGPVALRGLRVSPWAVEPISEDQSLSVYAEESKEGLSLNCYYNTGLFREATIELLLARFRTVLQCVSRDPGVRLWELQVEPEETADTKRYLGAGFRVLPNQLDHVSKPGEGQGVVTVGNSDSRAPGASNGKAQHQKHAQSPARDDLELQLVSLWEEMLGVRGISTRDDFFELGGDSLMAAKVFARIERTLGYTVPLAVLYQASTIESLASLLRRIGRRHHWYPLVPIRAGGSRQPLFLVHGAEGNVLLYRELAYHLGGDQPVYGLQSEGHDSSREHSPRIESLAASYVTAIRSVQPEGPYLVGGYCLGGTIAFEMAQQLQRSGQHVALVAMLESYNVRWSGYRKRFYHPLAHQLQNFAFHLQNSLLLGPSNRRVFLRGKLQVEISRLRIKSEYAAAWIRSLWRRSAVTAYQHERIRKDNEAAQAAYEPNTYAERLTILRPRQDFLGYKDRAMGWEGLAAGGVDVRELPVAPRGMLVEPFVRRLAEELTRCIESALQ